MEKAYVVLSIRDLRQMLASIQQKYGEQCPDITCGTFEAGVQTDSRGEKQICSYQLSRGCV
jgi:hypothetical protein